jgi:hypothetical protein
MAQRSLLLIGICVVSFSAPLKAEDSFDVGEAESFLKRVCHDAGTFPMRLSFNGDKAKWDGESSDGNKYTTYFFKLKDVHVAKEYSNRILVTCTSGRCISRLSTQYENSDYNVGEISIYCEHSNAEKALTDLINHYGGAKKTRYD